MRIRLDPAMLHESGNTPTFVPLVAGGSGDGYWKTETGARWKWTTRATYARVRCYATSDQNPYGSATYPNAIPYRVNGVDYWADQAALGDGWYDMYLPGGFAKTVELFVPFCNIIVFNGPVCGAFPVEIDFNDVATAIAPANTSPHLVGYGDSIMGGMNAPCAVLQGFMGTMKRGSSDLLLSSTSAASQPRYKGTYSAGTAYAINDVVSYTPSTPGATWIKTSSAAAGTTPAVGSDWQIRGFLGRVTQVAHGTRRLFDDCNGSPAQATFATYLASLNPTKLLLMIGTNDWVIGFATPAAFQAAYTGLLNALFSTSAALIPITCVSPLLTAGPASRESANGGGYTLDDFRSAVSAAVTAAMTAHPTMNITFVNGKVILGAGDLFDGLHPTRAGHQKLRTALQ